jgi:uncharacterized membrane protein
MIELSHIHPMLVHFPLAMLPLAVAIQWWLMLRGRLQFGRDCGASTVLVLVVVAALGALAAAAFGDMALDIAIDHGIPEARLENHEDLGETTAWLLLGLAALQIWFYVTENSTKLINVVMTLVSTAVLGVLITTAFFGGELVYKLGVNVG